MCKQLIQSGIVINRTNESTIDVRNELNAELAQFAIINVVLSKVATKTSSIL